MRVVRWLVANLVFWAGVPLGLTAWLAWSDEQALRSGRMTAQELSLHDSYGIPLYSLFLFTTLIVLAVNGIAGSVARS